MKLSISNSEATRSVEYITHGNGKFTCTKHQEVTSSDGDLMDGVIDT